MASGRTYSISTWDHIVEDWHVEASGLPLFGLRQWLRKLRGQSWDNNTMLVECEQ